MTIRSLPALSPLALSVRVLLLAGSLALGNVATAATAPAAPAGKSVTWEDIANDHLTTQDVLQYGMGTNAQRWSRWPRSMTRTCSS